MASDNDPLIFPSDQATEKSNQSSNQEKWKIIIADDEPNVHLVTQLALGGFEYLGKGLQLLSAYTENDVKNLLLQHPDTALVLLDVVMESVNSGFELIKYIREELGNKNLRIVLRTGQSGHSPEDKVIIDYDINDFKDKTELTVAKLRTTVISSLRSYHNQILLDQSRQYLQHVINQTSSCLITVDEHFVVKLWNLTAESLFETQSVEVVGKILWEVHPWFRNIEVLLQEALKTHKPSEHRNVPFQSKESSIINIRIIPLLTQTSSEILLRLDDVTEARRKEEQLSFIEKINAFGSIQRIWNDEFVIAKNKLTKTLKFQDSLSKEDIIHSLQEIQQTLNKFPFGLHADSSRKSSKLKPVIFDQWLKTQVESFHQDYQGTISLTLKDSDCYVALDETKFSSFFRSFLLSAINFNNEKETKIDFSIERKWLALEENKYSNPLQEKSYLCLTISIHPSRLSEILSTSFNQVVENPSLQKLFLSFGDLYQSTLDHRGFVELNPQVSNNFYVQFFFPEEKNLTSAQSAVSASINSYHGSGTILVCDDDAIMRQVTSNILSQFGFEVITASTGLEALKFIQQKPKDLRLIILDLMLPGMEGNIVFEEIKKIAGNIPVLFSSGFGKNERIKEVLTKGAAGFLQKPYSLEQLFELVVGILEKND
jgi:CheY-like chemotaxis protein